MNQIRSDAPVVAHIVSELRPGGVELRTFELLQHLNSPGRKHIIVTMSGRKGPLAGRFESLPVPVLASDIRHPLFPLWFWLTLRRQRISVVHSNIHYSSGYLLLLARIAGVPNRICHFRSDGSKKTGPFSRFKSAILRMLIDRSATSIVGVSPSALEGSWSEGWRTDQRCEVVQNGIDLTEFAAIEPADLTKEFGIDSRERPVIVHVGRADIPTKNREKAIRVLSALVKDYPHCVLLLVGRHGRDQVQSQENLERWERMAKELGVEDQICFAGERSDVKQILRAADCFLMTSTLEGLPGVLLEATAAGVPAVSTALPGAQFIQEVADHIKLLSPEATDEVWAQAVIDAIRANGERDVIRRKLIGSDFDINVSAQKFVELWNL